MPDALPPAALQIQAITDGLDQLAREMEMLWGIDRLRLLVGDGLRLKFDMQTQKLNDALIDGNPEYVMVQAEGMKRAWSALDKAARDAGQKPLANHIWEIPLPSVGDSIALVRAAIESYPLAKSRVVMTTTELGALLSTMPLVLGRFAPKAHTPNRKSRKPPRPPIYHDDGFDWDVGDELNI